MTHRISSWTFLPGLFLASLWFVTCHGDTTQNCTPRAEQACQEGRRLWLDSCGNPGPQIEACQCGCAELGATCKTPCVCEPRCEGRECGDDGCLGLCGPGCGADQTCDDQGQCQDEWEDSSTGQSYYLDAENGDDLADGTSPQTAWRTLDRIDQALASAQGNEAYLLRRGQVFQGSLAISRSGQNDANRLVIGAWGSGTRPIISGGVDLAGATWTQHQGAIWTTELVDQAKGLYLNGERETLARTPLRTMEEGGSRRQLKDSTLPGTASDYLGLTVRMKTSRRQAESKRITGFQDGVLSWDTDTREETRAGFGYFLEGRLDFLDEPGEWLVDGTRLYYWAPGGVNPETLTDLVAVVGQDGVTINGDFVSLKNLQVRFWARDGVFLERGNGLLLSNCVLEDLGNAGFYSHQTDPDGLVIRDSVFDDIAGVGIFLNQTSNAEIYGNTIQDIQPAWGLGLGLFGEDGATDDQFGSAITGYAGQGNHIHHNIIRRVGYAGIRLDGVGHLIERNWIEQSLLAFDDGGAIQSEGNGAAQASHDSIILENIVIEVIGSQQGTTASPDQLQAVGIYLGSGSFQQMVLSNTVVGARGLGALNQAGNHSNTFQGNTLVDSGLFHLATESNDAPRNTDNTYTHNLFVSRAASQVALMKTLLAAGEDDLFLGTLDHNTYLQPYGTDIVKALSDNGARTNYMDLAAWRVFTASDAMYGEQEQNSTQPFYGWINPEDAAQDIVVHLNPAEDPLVVDLPAGFEDTTGQSVVQLTIPPWTAAVVLRSH